MKNIISLTFVLSAIVVPFISCVADRDLGSATVSGSGEAVLFLTLRTPGAFSTVNSRSLTFDQENDVGTVDVLVFDRTHTLVSIKRGEDVVSTSGHSNPTYSGSVSFSVTLTASKTVADTYNLVVLANCRSVVDALGAPESIVDKSYESVTASLYGQLTGSLYSTGGYIPMWCESGDIVVEAGSESSAMVLRRAVARVDVGVGQPAYDSGTHTWSWDGLDADEAEIPFELSHVYIVRANDRYAIVPDRLKVTVPTVPQGTSAFSVSDSRTAFVFASTEGCVTQSIYVPESDILMGSVDREPGDANHANRMAVVVGGYYDDSVTETFYRLDFIQEGKLIDVMRNRMYRFSISKVAGAGYPDVETAYGARAVNMSADMLDWDVTDMGGVVFDGQYALTLSRTQVELDGQPYTSSDTDNTLRIRTDWPSGWTVESITDDATHAAAGWLDVEPADKTGTDKSVSLLLTENSTGTARSATIRITAGKMAIEVTVTQGLPAAVLTHISNTLPTAIPATEGAYTISVSTNLQSWGVKVYEGANTTPLLTRAANPSPAIDRNAAPVTSSITVWIPSNLLMTTTSDRSLVFVLYADEGEEVHIGSSAQKGYDRIGDNRRITWDGAKYVLTTDPTDAGLYFKFGGVTGIFSGNGANQVLPATTTDAFDPADVAWSPVAITGTANAGWATIPSCYVDDFTNIGAIVNLDSDYHTVANVKLGKGDPCRLVGLDLNRIASTDAALLTTADIDNGLWRMPMTYIDSEAFFGQEFNISYAAHWTTLSGSGVKGGMFPNATSGSIDTFLPAAGDRNNVSGAVSNQGSLGKYWSSSLSSGWPDGYNIQFQSNSISPESYTPFSGGLPVRCVRQ